MGLRAGWLRHRVAIEAPPTGRDATGGTAGAWVLIVDNLPAYIEPVSARELASSNRIGSEVTMKIMIRYRAGITADMRVRNLVDGAVYNIVGVLPDANSGREFLTLPCMTGINDG